MFNLLVSYPWKECQFEDVTRIQPPPALNMANMTSYFVTRIISDNKQLMISTALIRIV